MIRIERMSLRLPAGTTDPRAVAGEAAAQIARSLARSGAIPERLRITVGPGEDAGQATHRALGDDLRRGG